MKKEEEEEGSMFILLSRKATVALHIGRIRNRLGVSSVPVFR